MSSLGVFCFVYSSYRTHTEGSISNLIFYTKIECYLKKKDVLPVLQEVGKMNLTTMLNFRKNDN